MSNPLLKMLLPKLIEQAKSPDLKKKIISVVKKEKEKYTLEANQDVRILLSATNQDILIRIVLFDCEKNQVLNTLGIYRYEHLVELVSNLKI